MIGETLSHYRILERLGAGGMGEVFAAEDTRLGRRVALKVLPNELSGDPERLERFRREARAAAAINHAGVVTLYAVEEAGGTHFLTMELVEGESLDRAIPPEGLELERVFSIAVPLAEAVRAAHERGVVHRDLKPANVMLTTGGGVKVLDFGLARHQPAEGSGGETALVTENLLTRTGQLLGTPYYMSPEQVDGQPADARSDLFSLGVILYEMATGRRPFEGSSPGSVMSAILTREPRPMAELRPGTPRSLERIVRHCLEKSPERRFQTALDLRNELEQLATELAAEAAAEPESHTPRDDAARPGGAAPPVAVPPGPSVAERAGEPPAGAPADDRATAEPASPDASPPGPPSARSAPSAARRRSWPLWTLLGAAVVLALSLLLLGRSAREPATEPPRDAGAVQTLRPVTVSAAFEEYPAWSEDGRRIAFSREVDGYFKIFTHELATGEETQLTDGPVDDLHPAFSPDGATLFFVRSNRLDGKVQISDPYSMHERGDVWRLELATGKLQRILTEAFHPVVSPDGEHLAYYSDLTGAERIWISDPLGRNARQLTSDDSEQVSHLLPRWSPDGRLIVFQNNHWTTKFDIRVADVATGETRWVTDGPYTDVNPAFSADGTQIYFSSYRSGGMNIWRVPVDGDGVPTGEPEQMTTGAGADVHLAAAPDGSALAFSVSRLNADIWRLPVDPATARPAGPAEPLVETTREDSRGAWSPDGTRVAFNSDRGGQMNLYVLTLADGSTRQLTHGAGGDYQAHWSPDGSKLAFFSMRSGNADLWTVDLATGELEQLTDDPAIDINPFYSPDGRWIVFQSDRGGRREAWVMRADGTEERQLTSNTFGGVHFFCWSPDSRFVLFNGPERRAWRVAVDGGEPELVADRGGWHMSLAPGGDRILDNDHKALYVTPARPGAASEKIFEFEDPSIRIDYSVWSPDGRSILFDRLDPEAADIWLLDLGER